MGVLHGRGGREEKEGKMKRMGSRGKVQGNKGREEKRKGREEMGREGKRDWSPQLLDWSHL